VTDIRWQRDFVRIIEIPGPGTGSKAKMLTVIARVRGLSYKAWEIMKQVMAPQLQPAILMTRGRSRVAFNSAIVCFTLCSQPKPETRPLDPAKNDDSFIPVTGSRVQAFWSAPPGLVRALTQTREDCAKSFQAHH
jgi:hypothetical protein